MESYASKFVAQARQWLGKKEADGSYLEILEVYNSQKKLPRNHKMTETDPWCAAFVSAVAVKLGYTDIIPTECSCGRLIALLQEKNAWQEADDRLPKPGELIFYDWEAPATGENTGAPDHVGIVESVKNGKITVIEGNLSRAVKRREIPVNYRYIRGFGTPKFHKETEKGGYVMELQNLKNGNKGEAVRALQILLMGRGYSCGNSGADGIFGNDTHSAVCRYQKTMALEVDGIAGKETMSSLLGVA